MLHAAGVTFVLYEPQKASDIFACYQSTVNGRQLFPDELLWNATQARWGEFMDFLVKMIDWI